MGRGDRNSCGSGGFEEIEVGSIDEAPKSRWTANVEIVRVGVGVALWLAVALLAVVSLAVMGLGLRSE
jgi:hypothetical protein